MPVFSKISAAISAAALVFLMTSAAPSHALTALQSAKAGYSEKSAVIKVHGSWRDDDDDNDEDYREYRHRHHRDAVVDAPFTHVETGRRVVVDAPFAHVSVNRNGRHIVAPFVNLWLPRY